MTLQALFAALCIMCSSPPATAGDLHRSQECFANQTQAWRIYPGQHLYHHKTPNGTCYHIGPKNHSGVLTLTRQENGTVGKHTHTGQTTGLVSHKTVGSQVQDKWKTAKPTPWRGFIDLHDVRHHPGSLKNYYIWELP